ncbi:MAG: DUF4384 domain-containing protein [Deltaproteobacteria bacterium]|nr:DUF4384 domain-containing protein [Deltaproteobacteria bacterium]
MKRWFAPAAAALMTIVASCAGTAPQQGPETAPPATHLNRWVDEVLSPYLVEQLGGHPKFKGRPFLIVRMKGDDVQAEIDDLTAQIREKVIDALMARPGINLVWRPAVQPWRHHRTLEDVTCGDYRKLRFYVGIDTGLTKVDRRLYVKVRCLNLKEASWVSGFGMSWEGTPGRAQLAALDRGHTDEYLRGLRPLPFTGDQPDLLAAYLSHNLSCLFKQREMDEIVVHVDRKTAPETPYFQTVFDLTGNYLARFREVRVTEDPDLANTRVRMEVHAIHEGLYQVWASAMYKAQDQFVPGAETEAYAESAPGAAAVESPPGPIRVSTGARRTPLPALPLISAFNLVTPLSQAYCGTETPWRGGERYLPEGHHLPAGGCIAVETALNRPGRIYLIGQDGRSQLTRLYPSSCEAFKRMRRLLYPGESLRFPPAFGQTQSLILEEQPGTERVYAVAVTDARMAERFEQDLRGFQGLCAVGEKTPGRELGIESDSGDPVILWQAYLDNMARESHGTFEWQVRAFQHDPPGI